MKRQEEPFEEDIIAQIEKVVEPRRHNNRKCHCRETYTCCDCGGNGCGCAYCWSCNACDRCQAEG